MLDPLAARSCNEELHYRYVNLFYSEVPDRVTMFANDEEMQQVWPIESKYLLEEASLGVIYL